MSQVQEAEEGQPVLRRATPTVSDPGKDHSQSMTREPDGVAQLVADPP